MDRTTTLSAALLFFTALAVCCIPPAEPEPSFKSASLLIDAGMRHNAMQNIERFEWARNHKNELHDQVAPFMEISPERLWSLLPSQEMGRARRTYSQHSQTSPHSKGSPQCYLDHGGEDVGSDQSRVDLLGRPWQVQCMRCGTWYPKNDFHAYYESALDETGRFRIGEGDPQFLEPREGVEGEARHWIEDGTGVEYDGYRWFFAAKYADEVWREMARTARNMALLYTLTEEPAYARRAAIILDRMADFYPEMDERPHREGGMFTSYGPGRIMGRGWEYTAIRRPVAEAYDYIYDAIRRDEELAGFLARKSRAHNGPDKSTFEAIDRNIRDNLLVEFIEDIIEHREDLQRGRAQSALAIAAVALDDPQYTPGYLDWMFDGDGGRLPYTLIEHMQREGFNVNSGLGYMSTSGRMMVPIAEALGRYGGPEHDMYAEYPNLLNSFTMLGRVRMLGKSEPAVGDGGSSMQMSMSTYPPGMLLDGYRRFGGRDIAGEIIHSRPDDWHQAILEQAIYEEDPEGLLEEIRDHLPESPQPHRSYNSGGTGFAALQAPWRESERAAAIWYGRTMWPSHAHADRLTLHLWAFGETMMPDLGYPEYTGAWPKRHGFTRHTISHNTLMIDDSRQGSSYAGKTKLFADAGPLRVADIDGLGSDVETPYWDQQLYRQAHTYRRAAIMVDLDESDSYLLDLFWARGGEVHRLIQNAGSTRATPGGLNLTPQPSGTFAGPDVGFGQQYDGELTWGYEGSGFQFLKNVERDENPPESFRIDWPIDPRYEKPDGWQAYMRLHNITPVDEVALAHGEPARGHPDRIRYSLRSRFGQDLSSQFISVIEPYMYEPFIESARVLKRVENESEPFAAAVEVRLRDGRRDVILARKEPGTLQVGKYYLDGRIGLIRYAPGGEVKKLVAVAAAELRAGEHVLVQPAGVYRGELVSFDDSDPHNVLLHLSEPLPEEAAGRYIIFDNEEAADGSYRIQSVEDPYTVNIGRMPLFERLAVVDDFEAGVIYNIRPGEPYIVPQTAVLEVE